MTRHAQDLKQNPLFLTKSQPEPPVSVAMGHLTATDGDDLTIMANVNNETMARAIVICDIYAYCHGSAYMKMRGTLLKQLSVAKDKGGRLDIIDVVRAGGNLPAEFYEQGGQSRSWAPYTTNGVANND